MTYDVLMYNAMIADRVRTDAYARAMRAVIRPGAIVADIGTGSGYFAVLACKLGAAKVYAVEPDTVIDVARLVAARNGFADRIEFIQDISTRVTLDQKVDVVVSDLRGALPLHEAHLTAIADLRRRYLKRDGVLIPTRDELYACLLNSPTFYATVTEAANGTDGEPDLSTTRTFLRNTRTVLRSTADECTGNPVHLGSLDYSTLVDPHFRSQVEWTAEASTTAHGLVVWFDAVLWQDIGFSNSPACPDTVYGRSAFPFLEPATIEKGDHVTVSFSAFLVKQEYLFSWGLTVTSGSNPLVKKTCFRQSSLDGAVVSRDRLLRQRNDFIPFRSENYEILQFVLDRIDGTVSLESIARSLAKAFPERFQDWDRALAFVGKALERNR
jgi:protein arginine N-methyltransferase 1